MNFDMKKTTEQIISTSLQAAEQAGISIVYIMTLTRDIPYEQNLSMLDIAISSELSGYFAGIDIAGDEETIPLDTLKPLIQKAVDKGKKITIHAGEAGPARNVAEAIQAGATRVGHGISSFKDPETLESAIKACITYEVCPTSNLQTSTIKSVEELQIPDLLKKGVRITINTDDPGISGTTLTNELEIVQQTFSLTKESLKILTHNSIQGAFVSESQKQTLMKETDRFFSP
jgi:adenosine deaminase